MYSADPPSSHVPDHAHSGAGQQHLNDTNTHIHTHTHTHTWISCGNQTERAYPMGPIPMGSRWGSSLGAETEVMVKALVPTHQPEVEKEGGMPGRNRDLNIAVPDEVAHALIGQLEAPVLYQPCCRESYLMPFTPQSRPPPKNTPWPKTNPRPKSNPRRTAIQVMDADMHHLTGHNLIQGHIHHDGQTPFHLEIPI